METGAHPVWGPPNTAPPSTPSAQSSRVHSIHWWAAVFRVSKATAASFTPLALSSRIHSIHWWVAVFRVSKATAPSSTRLAQSSRVHFIHWCAAAFRVSKATAPSSTRLAQSSRVHYIHWWAAVFRVSKAATYLVSTYPHLVYPWSTHPPVSTVIQGMLHLPGGRQWSGCQRPSHTRPPTYPHSNCPHGTTTLLLAAVAGIQLRGPKSIRCLTSLTTPIWSAHTDQSPPACWSLGVCSTH